MSFLRGTEEYYQKFIELQEKLRKSEEERLVLEMKFNEMVQVTREEEQAYYRKLRNQYKRFLEEDRRRQERNERIMRILERIESRAAILAAKTERFEFLRQQYQAYLQRIFFSTKHTCESAQSPHIPEVSTILEEKPDLNNYGLSSKTTRGDNFEGINHPAHLYEHPIVRKALSGNKGEGTLHPKADVVKQYLRSLSSPISGEEVLKATRSSEKMSSLHTSELADSNDDYSYYKTNAGNIADQIINSINSRPKLSSPYHDRYVTSTHHLDQNRGKLSEKSFCGTTYSPKHSIGKNNYDVEVFNEKDLTPKFAKDETQFPSKSKEISKRSEVSFQKFSGEKDNRIFASEIPRISVQEMDDGDDKMPTVDDEVLRTSDLKERSFINEGYQVHDTETNAGEHHGMDKVDDRTEYVTIPPLDDSAQEPVKDDHEIIEKSEIEDTSEETDEKGRSADEKYIVTTDKLHDENTVNKDISQYHKIVEEYKQPEQDINVVALADYEDPQYHEHNNQLTLDYQDEPLTSQYTELNAYDNTQSKLENDQDDINVYDIGATITNIEPQVVLEKDVDQDDNVRGVQEIRQHVKDNSESKQYIEKDVEQHEDRNQTDAHHKKSEQKVPNQKNSDHFATELENKESVILYNEDLKAAEQSIVHHHQQNQPVTSYDERDDADMQYDEQGRPLMQYDEKGQPLVQYDEKGQHLMHYNKEDESIMQYDEKGQPLIQYDERGQPITQYDQDGQFIYQYDQNGQPIMQYDDNGQQLIQYDENGQPIMQYDARSQPTLQYDEHGQPIMQYDENGQPIMQYDANGQPMLQYNYDENDQSLMYDQQGQPLYQYENQEYYAENQMYNAQQYSEEPQTVTEHPSKVEVPPLSPATEKQSNATEKTKDTSKHQLSQNITEASSNAEISSKEELPVNLSKQQPAQPTSPGNEKQINKSDKSKDSSKQQNLKQNSPNKEKKANVMDMLDTDTESIRQESKVSNDSDFDFSSK